MNPAQLLAHFDRLSDAPDAMPRLRRFILDLAVRGKLVQQGTNGESAAGMLKQMGRRFSPVPADDEPYARPKGWEFVRLGDSLNLINGRAFKPTDWLTSGLPIVRIQNLNNPAATFNFCDPASVAERHVIDNGCFLISWSGTPGTSFGAFIWNRGKAVLNQHIFKCLLTDDAYYDRFLQLAINGRLDEMIAKAHGGVGLQHITKGKLERLVLALPPRTEQHRIVTKVDELMALCDRLEAAQKERESRRDRLAAASLARLNNGADDAAFKGHARFHLRHLSRLTSRPEHIHQLRQTIVSLAVRGKLVPQDSSDESASIIQQRIAKDKGKTIHRGPIGTGEPFELVEGRERPFSLPPSWGWVRIGDIASIKHGFAFSSQLFTDRVTEFVLTTPGNFYERGGFRDRGPKTKYYSGSVEQEFILKPGDLIIPMTEQAAGLLGSPAFIPDDGKTYLHNQRLGKIGIYTESIAPDFIFLFFNCEFFRRELARTSTGQKVRHTSPKRILRVPFPLCSLAEQRRIVAKVDELMALCDRLEAQLTTAQDSSRRLLEAVLQEALAPTG